MAARKVLAGFAGLALGVGVLASVTNAAPPCGRKACRDEVAASGRSGRARRACLKKVIADCRANRCSCTDGSPPCSCACGDGLCGPSEDCSTCSQDCGPCATTTTTTSPMPSCTGAGDCPIGTACNTTTGQCESACGDASHSICHGGCCGGGTCQPGTVPSACGSGRACVVCDATNPSGSACVIGPTEGFGGHCGCNASETDCPAASEQSGGEACLLAGIDLCTTECLGPNETGCNGGCCTAAFGTTGGTCQPGTADTACGVNTGGPCVDCTASLNHCVNGTCMP